MASVLLRNELLDQGIGQVAAALVGANPVGEMIADQCQRPDAKVFGAKALSPGFVANFVGSAFFDKVPDKVYDKGIEWIIFAAGSA